MGSCLSSKSVLFSVAASRNMSSAADTPKEVMPDTKAVEEGGPRRADGVSQLCMFFA